MTAGRELDALVAEKVMGWQRFPYVLPGAGQHVDGDVVERWGATTVTVNYCPPGRVHVSTIRTVPFYSTSIDAAWTVVEKLRDTNASVELSAYRHEVKDDVPLLNRVAVWGGNAIGMETKVAETTAETMPLAICRAALAAVGVEVPA